VVSLAIFCGKKGKEFVQIQYLESLKKKEFFDELQKLPEVFSNQVSKINIRTQAIPYFSLCVTYVSIKHKERRGSCESSGNVWYVPISFRSF